jgi:hypothetical protein
MFKHEHTTRITEINLHCYSNFSFFFAQVEVETFSLATHAVLQVNIKQISLTTVIHKFIIFLDVTEVWMDDYKQYYYASVPLAKNIPFGK